MLPDDEPLNDDPPGDPLDEEPSGEPPSIPTVEALPPHDTPAITPRPRKQAAAIEAASRREDLRGISASTLSPFEVGHADAYPMAAPLEIRLPSGVVLSTVRPGADADSRLVVVADCWEDPDPEPQRVLVESSFTRQATVTTARRPPDPTAGAESDV